MYDVVTAIQNENDEKKQLELYLLNEDNLTGKDLYTLYNSRFVGAEVKRSIGEAVEQMKQLRKVGMTQFNERLKVYKTLCKLLDCDDTSSIKSKGSGTDEFTQY